MLNAAGADVTPVTSSAWYAQFVTEFITAQAHNDASYLNPTTGAGLAGAHILQVAQMLGGLVSVASPGPGDKSVSHVNTFLVSTYGASYALPEVSNIGLVAAQLGSNAVIGALAVSAGQVPSIAAGAGSADSDPNACGPGGALSLYAAINDQSLMNAVPEFSCLSYSAPDRYD